jgi:hypothetical protein
MFHWLKVLFFDLHYPYYAGIGCVVALRPARLMKMLYLMIGKLPPNFLKYCCILSSFVIDG